MSSIIKGYNYDIFISYRQKDNKGERWVSEFVEALKTELESTFKEEISVYFDINPHDGLLETHDVDESLKEKLKCLVFIPIISRTYCDPKSFAWEHEFKAFVELEKLKLSGERISVVVMPFQNMTNDTLWNIWQDGIQDILINSLSNSEELKVRQAEYINKLVRSQGIVNYTSITPSVASTISQKLDANVMINGNVKQAGDKIRLYAQLIDPETEEVFKSFQIEGGYKEENIFHLIDSLSIIVKNFLIISELEKEIPVYYKQLVSTNSPDAYRYFIQGRDEYAKWDYLTAINLFSKALAIDSNFIQAIISTSLANGNQFEHETMYSSAFESLYLYDLAKKVVS